MTSPDTKTIKSAERVLHVLEFFDSCHTKATVMDISRQFGYPQSSTSELLHSLAKMGYLSYDRYRRTYEPTARVALLGAWVQPGLFRKGHLLPVLDEVSRICGQTVTLSSQVGLDVHVIHVVPPRTGTSFVAQGHRRSLLRSSIGRLFLSCHTEASVRAIVHRLNADEADPERRVKLLNLAAELKQIRQQGFAAEYGELEYGCGSISVLLACRNLQVMAVTITGPADEIRAHAEMHRSALRAALRALVRPGAVDDPQPATGSMPAADFASASRERTYAIA